MNANAAHGYPNSPPPNLTSQCCTAVSIDTCTAVARFFIWFWRHARAWVVYPRVFAKPAPVLFETRTGRTPGHGYGFSGVRARVAWKTPGFPVPIPYHITRPAVVTPNAFVGHRVTGERFWWASSTKSNPIYFIHSLTFESATTHENNA